MRQIELFPLTSEREVQLQQRLATGCIANSAYGEVTNHVKPEGTRFQAVTQVKELSPEIPNVSEAEAVHLAEGSSLATAKRRGGKNLTGSETTGVPRSSLNPASESLAYSKLNQRSKTQSCVEAGNCQTKRRQGKMRVATGKVNGLSPETRRHYRKPSLSVVGEGSNETFAMVRMWRPIGVVDSDTHLRIQRELGRAKVLHRDVVCDDKPVNGEELQKEPWQSDQLIVVRKPRNGGGAKGLAGRPGNGDTSSVLRDGQRKSTKLSSLSERAGEKPRIRFTSLVHYLTVDFLRECFRELKRNKASGVDGVTVEEYEVNLDENLKDVEERLKEKRYRPKPVRRVYIPKPKGGTRC